MIIEELQVYLSFKPNNPILVGSLLKKKQELYFEYDSSFLKLNLNLSPYHLPLRTGVFNHKNFDFGELFGLFDDSLPDGWGKLLMDRQLKKMGLVTRNITQFQRLSYLGDFGMGALGYRPQLGNQELKKHVELSELLAQAKRVVEGNSPEDVITELALLGGSPAGARPKILVLEKADGTFSSEINKAKDKDIHWLVKFNMKNLSDEFQDFSKIEYLYSLLAKASNIDIAQTKLLTDKKKNHHFAIERFDRRGNERIHMHSFGGLIQSNYRIPSCDYEDLFKVTLHLTQDENEVYRLYRLMLFNVLTHNRDDHVKNFSFLLGEDHKWKLSPAYDLTPSQGPGGEHSLTILGEGNRPSIEHCEKLAFKMGIPKEIQKRILEEVRQGLSQVKVLAQECGISKKDLVVLKNYLSLGT